MTMAATTVMKTTLPLDGWEPGSASLCGAMRRRLLQSHLLLRLIKDLPVVSLTLHHLNPFSELRLLLTP